MKRSNFLDADIEFEISEEFNNPQNRTAHYNKHITNRKEYDMSEADYEQAAEDLAKTPCDYKKIYGYMSKDPKGRVAYAKYNKETELFTVYYYRGDKPLTITAFRRSWRDFYGKMYSDEKYPYVDEIPRGK